MTRKPNKRGAKPASSKPIPSKVELDGEEGFGEEHDDAANDDAVIGAALKWSGIALAAIVVSAGVVGYIWTRPETVVMKPETPVNEARPRQAPPVEIPKVHFTDVTQSAGISFVHENGATGNKLLPETMGGGCAFFDFDSDGDQDLLLVNSCHWPSETQNADPMPTSHLYRNDGTGSFEDVTAGSGLDVCLYAMGAAVGDYDNDGRVDVFLSTLNRNQLFHNDGDGKFTNVTDAAGVAGDPADWSTSCGWLDFDSDGDLDLFVCNYLVWTREYDLSQEFQLTGGTRAYGRPQNFEGSFSKLYRNDGDGRFADVSEAAGICVTNPATNVPMGKSLGVTFNDFDGDGWMDIVVANDTVQNFFFRNAGNGTFEESAAISGIAFDPNGNARGAMGIDTANFRNNDSIGVAIGNFSNEMTALYVASSSSMQFTDEAISTGLGPNTRLELTFGVTYVDFDLDGRQDLFASNGHLEEDINRVQPSQTYEQPPQLFWNCGPEHSTEFLPVPLDCCGEEFMKPMVGRGSAVADIDNDGDLDLLITATGRAPRLMRNDQELGHHWLRVKLTGTKSNRDAIGARVIVKTAARTQIQQVMPTRSYLSQSELPITFGLGDTDVVESVEIRWPDGSTQTLNDVVIDQLIHVEQP